MSRIILSCGHEVFDFSHAYHIMTKGTDRYGLVPLYIKLFVARARIIIDKKGKFLTLKKWLICGLGI
jgi:hypothetical protein